MQRVHLPQSLPACVPSGSRPGSGASAGSSSRVTMQARNSQLPNSREISIAFFPVNPIPARAAQPRSSTGPVST